MSDVATAVNVEKKFNVEIIYNGLSKSLKVDSDDTVKEVLDRAIKNFGAQQPHLLALYTSAGAELTHESQTLEQVGIHACDQLLLRPSQVRGG